MQQTSYKNLLFCFLFSPFLAASAQRHLPFAQAAALAPLYLASLPFAPDVFSGLITGKAFEWRALAECPSSIIKREDAKEANKSENTSGGGGGGGVEASGLI